MNIKRIRGEDGKYTYVVEVDPLEMGTLAACVGTALVVQENGPDCLDIDPSLKADVKINLQLFDVVGFAVQFLNDPNILPPSPEDPPAADIDPKNLPN